MKWSRRIGDFVKYFIGAIMCGCTAFLCIEPFLRHQTSTDEHHSTVGEWLLGFLVIPGICLFAFICVVCTVFCLVLAFRSLSGRSKFE